MTFERGIAWALGIGATVFVLLLGGAFSGALTDDPPAVNPYATGSSDTTEAPTTTAAATTTQAPAADPAEEAPPEADPPPTASPVNITIEGFDFGAPVTATVGQTVIVTNADGAPHTWTAADGTFDSSTIQAGGGTFEFVFDTAGTYDFFCSIHRSMTGTITVEG